MLPNRVEGSSGKMAVSFDSCGKVAGIQQTPKVQGRDDEEQNNLMEC
jgi:hypothetical protein